jgi:hypothetical protein
MPWPTVPVLAQDNFVPTVMGYDGSNTRPISTDASGNVNVNAIPGPPPASSSEVSLLASASRTTTQTSADQTNNVNGHFLTVILDVTVNAGGAGSITLSINGKDPASGKYYAILTGVPVTAVSTNIYRLGPGLVDQLNQVANDVAPRTFQIVVTANNANPVTYSVGYVLR